MATMILPCTCKDEYQDSVYGKGRRVHNVGGKGKEKLAYCTVCSPSNQRVLRLHSADSKKPERGAKKV